MSRNQLEGRYAGKFRGVHLFKRKIKLSGYYDDNYFDNVHKHPHTNQCDCGRKFTYQWFRDGVEFEWEKSK